MARLITRNEAAQLLGVTPQSISNYIQRGILNCKEINNQLMIDRNSIECLFDGLKDIVFMEKRISALKLELTQAENSLQMKLKDLRSSEELLNRFNSPRLLTNALQAIFDVAGQDLLCYREKEILQALFEGKTISDIADRFSLSDSSVIKVVEISIRKIGELKKYAILHKECKELKAENIKLKYYVETLDRVLASIEKTVGNDNPDPIEDAEEEDKERLSELLSTKIVNLNLDVRTLIALKAADIETLGEIVKHNIADLVRLRHLGKKSIARLEEYIERLGLHFGMNTDSLVKEEIRQWRLQRDKNKEDLK